MWREMVTAHTVMLYVILIHTDAGNTCEILSCLLHSPKMRCKHNDFQGWGERKWTLAILSDACMHVHIIYTIYWLTRSSRWWQNSPALWGATSFHLSLPSTTRLWSRDHLESVIYVLVWGSVHYRQVSFIQRGLLSRDKLYLGCWSCQEAWRSGQSPVHQYESAHRRATLRLYKTDNPET